MYLAGLTAAAQVRFSSMEAVWDYANEHSIQVQAAHTNEELAALGTRSARGRLLPVVTVNGAFTDNIRIQQTLVPAKLFNPAAPEDLYTAASFGRRYIYTGNVAAQMDLLNISSWFSLKSAKLQESITALELEQTKKDLYGQLADSYFSCLLLQEAEKLAEENVSSTTALYTTARNKYSEGLISEAVLNTALINKSKAVQSLQTAQQQQQLQLNNLRILLQLPDSLVLSPVTLPADMVAAGEAFVPDPATQLARQQMLLAKNEWQASRAAYAPVLSAVYQFSSQVAADELLQFGNSNTTPQQYWGLRLSVPLFTGGTRKYQTAQSKKVYNLRQEQYKVQQLQSSIVNDNLLLARNSAARSWQQSANILALYKNNDAHAARKMDEGILSLEERLKVYADLLTYQETYLQNMNDYFIQQYRLLLQQINLK